VILLIINELTRYYENSKELTIEGFNIERVDFCIVISKDGELLSVEKLKEGKEEYKVLPKDEDRKSSIHPYFMWDNFKYIFSQLTATKNKNEEIIFNNSNNSDKNYFKAFKKKQEEVLEYVDCEDSRAYLKFLDMLERYQIDVAENIKNIPYFFDNLEKLKIFLETKNNCIFRIDTQIGYLHDNEEIKQAWISYLEKNDDSEIGQCYVLGIQEKIEENHSLIKGVLNTQMSGGKLVGINQDSFESYGKKKSKNYKISKKVVNAYTTALNYLLTTNRFILTDITVAFWSSRSKQDEEAFISVFDRESVEDTENIIKTRLKKLRTTHNIPANEMENDFHILGLSGNSARIAIEFFYMNSFENIIRNHNVFEEEMKLIGNGKINTNITLKNIVKTAIPKIVGKDGKEKESQLKLSAKLEKEMFVAVLENTLFPREIYNRIIDIYKKGMIFSEEFYAVSFIKGYLSRIYKFKNRKESLSMALDKENEGVAYRLGRLFAVLEKVQKTAQGELNSTIKDKYVTSACTNPAGVYPILISLYNHHIEKLDLGLKHFHENLVQEVLEKVGDFPTRFNMEEQGEFILGYYHQKQDFYKKNKDTKKEEVETDE
jgi:CRISPR-associated protein Csd1